MSMYFGVSWLDPRIKINESASEWTEVKTGPKDVSIYVCKIISQDDRPFACAMKFLDYIFTKISAQHVKL